MAREPEALIHAIYESCRNKAEVVAQDEKETGVRAILNFGHTFGHAIETATGYGTWLHGEAVAMGIVLAARASKQLGQIDASELSRIGKVLSSAKLPLASPKISADRYIALMGNDKKVEGGEIRLVLLDRLGRALVQAAKPEFIRTVVSANLT